MLFIVIQREPVLTSKTVNGGTIWGAAVTVDAQTDCVKIEFAELYFSFRIFLSFFNLERILIKLVKSLVRFPIGLIISLPSQYLQSLSSQTFRRHLSASLIV